MLKATVLLALSALKASAVRLCVVDEAGNEVAQVPAGCPKLLQVSVLLALDQDELDACMIDVAEGYLCPADYELIAATEKAATFGEELTYGDPFYNEIESSEVQAIVDAEVLAHEIAAAESLTPEQEEELCRGIEAELRADIQAYEQDADAELSAVVEAVENEIQLERAAAEAVQAQAQAEAEAEIANDAAQEVEVSLADGGDLEVADLAPDFDVVFEQSGDATDDATGEATADATGDATGVEQSQNLVNDTDADAQTGSEVPSSSEE